MAVAQIARNKATIDRKTIRAAFRARVGISDVHPGQYLSEGTYLTSLQGVDQSAYVDFAAVSDGHDMCQPGGVRWVEPAFGGNNVVHPNALGEAGMAARVLEVISWRAGRR